MSRRVAFNSGGEHFGCFFVLLPLPLSQDSHPLLKYTLPLDQNSTSKILTGAGRVLCLHHPSLSRTPTVPEDFFFFLRWGGGVSKRDVLILQPSKSNRILSEIFAGIPECKLTVLIMTFPLWDHLGDSLSYLVSCSSLT